MEKEKNLSLKDDIKIDISEENLENFSPEDFFQFKNESIKKKTELFSDYFQHIVDTNVVMRQVTSAASHRMTTFTPCTGDERDVLMFGSNNYLGLANEPEIINETMKALLEVGIGCGGPPLLNGYTKYHKKLEQRIAELKHCEDAMLYSSGFAANLGWVSGLLSEGDYLLYDAQNHASLYDGIKLGKFNAIRFLHNDIKDLEKQLKLVRRKTNRDCIVAVEGVYSMDGDIAPLPEIRKLCDKYDSLLCVDDAHGSGILGERGRGTTEYFGMAHNSVDIVMGTFSKTFGVAGGFIAGNKDMINYLRFFSRPYMFSASLPPHVVASVNAGIEFIKKHPERIKQLHENAQYMLKGLLNIGYNALCHTAIIPIFIPQEYNIPDLVTRIHNEGVFVNGVVYPAVPKDRQRLRMSIMATMNKEDLDFALSKFEKVGKEVGILK